MGGIVGCWHQGPWTVPPKPWPELLIWGTKPECMEVIIYLAGTTVGVGKTHFVSGGVYSVQNFNLDLLDFCIIRK